MYIDGLDEIDNGILNIIEKNARLSYSEIGEKMNLSRVTIKNRMEALEQKGIIKGYETVINPTAAAEGRRFFLDIVTEPDKFDEIADRIARYDIVRKVYAITGESRIHVEGFASGKMKYETFMSTIKRQIKGVKAFAVQDVLYTIKNLDEGVGYEELNKQEK